MNSAGHSCIREERDKPAQTRQVHEIPKTKGLYRANPVDAAADDAHGDADDEIFYNYNWNQTSWAV